MKDSFMVQFNQRNSTDINGKTTRRIKLHKLNVLNSTLIYIKLNDDGNSCQNNTFVSSYRSLFLNCLFQL